MDFGIPLTDSQKRTLESSFHLASVCQVNQKHTNHVTNLALLLFEETFSLHGLGDRERFYLLCAAVVHQAGYIGGREDYHKSTLHIVLKSPLLQMSQKERFIIGSIARYHRGTLPAQHHDHFITLDREEQFIVSVLGGILRLADALVVDDDQPVKKVKIQTTRKLIKLTVVEGKTSKQDAQRIAEKGDLLGMVFKRNVQLVQPQVDVASQ